MNRKRFLLLALITAFCLVIFSFPLTVNAIEGEEDTAPEVGVGDESSEPPLASEPEPPVDMTPEPTPDQPSEPPVETDPPSSDPEPPVDSSISPEPSGGDGEDPSSSEEENPISTTTEEPTITPPPSESSSSHGHAVSNVRPSLTSRPISTPRPSISRTKVDMDQTANTAQGELAPTGSNYVTFARVNVRNNSLASTLFYSGSGCVALGALGLLALLVLFLRGRRHRGYEVQNEVLGQIQEAEIRNRMAAANYQKAPSQPRGEPPLSSASRGNTPLVPMAADLYTEEFSLPDQPQPQAQEAPKPPQEPPAVPPPRQSAVSAPPASSPEKKTSFDTEEILKEFLPRD